MTLNLDKVRALISMIDDLSVPYAGNLAPHHDTARALAEEWLAARTVRWDGDTLHGPGFYGAVVLDCAAATFGASARGIGEVSWVTEPEARAWLEAKAREAGYEIEGGA